MANSNYIAVIEYTVAGIPCLVGVIDYSSVKGSHNHNAPSDWDYHGYTDCDFDLLDRKGYRADWLAKKMTTKDEDAITKAISNHMGNNDGY